MSFPLSFRKESASISPRSQDLGRTCGAVRRAYFELRILGHFAWTPETVDLNHEDGCFRERK